jgi:DNA polymerase III delta subunit
VNLVFLRVLYLLEVAEMGGIQLYKLYKLDNFINFKMLFVFNGNDEVLVRAKARAHALSLQGENCDFLLLESDTFSPAVFDESFFAQSFFGTSFVIFCDNVFENKEASEFFEKFAEEIVSSPNNCVLAEKTLPVALATRFKKAGVKILDFKVEKKDERKFNTFALGDALGMKDKKNLWILFAQAREMGLEGEEICGVLFWQIKNILLAGSTKTAIEAGVSEYPYKKAKSFSKIWKKEELQDSLLELTKMYHDAHRGRGNFMNQLEMFVLAVK